MKNVLFIIGLILILFSCSSKKKDFDLDYIEEKIEELLIPMEDCYKNIIVLPGLGCSGCISEGENFLANNYNNKDYLFVLTKINSLKELSNKVGIDVTKYSNIYIDDPGVFFKKSRLIYPLVVFFNCNKSKVDKIKIQKPGNDAFKGL